LDTVAFFVVGLLSLDIMFSLWLVECLSQVGRGKPLRVDADQSSVTYQALRAKGTAPFSIGEGRKATSMLYSHSRTLIYIATTCSPLAPPKCWTNMLFGVAT
jgi:hypothetical protein